ncbi:MAG: UDP-N-acetylmuramoyl-L-alanyl-D-glutamate--2,6-diaminopimelate ligase [Bacteroidota bacterium]
MKTLEELFPDSAGEFGEIEILDIQSDSRKVKPGSLFIATKGLTVDGHAFIAKAIENGAVGIICEVIPEAIPEGIAIIKVNNSAMALVNICKTFFDNPSEQLSLIGVTGTNGKTTIATLLYRLLNTMGHDAGLLSTVENRIGKDKVIEATQTTPNIIEVYRLLRIMVDAGCDYAVMEVSSHAIDQNRIGGLFFQVGIFSNLTHDHLDYHGSFDAYMYTKKKFFDQLEKNAFALINSDDRYGEIMAQNSSAKVSTYSLKKIADFKAKVKERSINGLHLDINGKDFHSYLTGDFNAYNLLAVFGTAILLSHDESEILEALSTLRPAEGRFDVIQNSTSTLSAIVDYAHTPDALENVLNTISKVMPKNAKLITVVGCGGNRDKKKRPKMAYIAAHYSDQVILTSDNPRDEDPLMILQEMKAGLDKPEMLKKALEIENRKEAIKTAIALANSGDIILVAGKGHEKYQEIKGEKFPFDDKEILIEAMG